MTVETPPPVATPPVRLPQFNPAFAVIQASPGVDANIYTRRLAFSLWPHVSLSSAAGMALATYASTRSAGMELPTQDAVAATMPAAAVATLRARASILHSQLAEAFPVPQGENILATEVSCLLEPLDQLPSGTVFLLRTTDVATVVFFLPAIRVDLVSGDVLPVALPRGTTPKKPLAVLAMAEREGMGVGAGAGSAALQMAATLSFALPAPWGPVASAGFSLIELLAGPAAPGFATIINQAVTELEDFITHQAIATYATEIKGLIDWIAQQQSNLSLHESAEYISATVLPELRRMVAPGPAASMTP